MYDEFQGHCKTISSDGFHTCSVSMASKKRTWVQITTAAVILLGNELVFRRTELELCILHGVHFEHNVKIRINIIIIGTLNFRKLFVPILQTISLKKRKGIRFSFKRIPSHLESLSLGGILSCMITSSFVLTYLRQTLFTILFLCWTHFIFKERD
uniref:Uncharacterized protein n=1 Tax=Cacopsylla melanoneura TaxID=428564 RepID=A0A8D9EHV7_9HEMI